MSALAAADRRIHLSVDGPFSAATVLWQRQAGEPLVTVVVKATYALESQVCALVDEPEPVQLVDDHWDDDAGRSIHVPSDLAPFKTTFDVMVVGHAYAERALEHTMVRIAVGSIDKMVEVWTPRRMAADGTVETSAPVVRMPLRYEVAPGGPETENPVGIDPTSFDPSIQRYRIPQLLLPNQVLEAGGFIKPVGLGPLSPDWSQRRSFTRPQDRQWLRDPRAQPLPVGFDARCFGTAPPDQQSDVPFRADERLLLEGLHPQNPRLVTNLAGVAPMLSSRGSLPMPPLVADSLFIDTDRGIVTLTFRATLPLGDGKGALDIRVTDGAMTSEIRAASAVGESTLELTRAPEPEPSKARARPTRSAHEDALDTTSVSLDADVESHLALPFSSGSPRGRLGSSVDDGALPFRTQSAAPPSPPPTAARGSASVPPAPPSPRAVAPSSPPATSLSLADPAAVGVRSAMPVLRPLSSALAAAPPSLPQPPVPAPSTRGQTIGEQRAAVPSAGASETERPLAPSLPATPQINADTFEAAFGGVKKPLQGAAALPLRALAPAAATASAKALSDAALGAQPAAAPVRPANPSERDDTVTRPRRRALVDLLSADEGLARRLRRAKAFAPVLTEFVPPRTLRRSDEPDVDRDKDRDERARLEVLRVLSCGEPSDAPGLYSALDQLLDDASDLEIPLFLVSGELRPTFDDIETLKTAVKVVAPLGGSDKRLQTVLAVARDALSAPSPPSSEAALALVRQIEAATQPLSLPPKYLAEAVERSLLEARSYKRRTILGEPRIRADFAFGAGGAWPMYVPEAAAQQLPMLTSFAVVALVEVRPREDAAEAHSEALVVRALGRVVRVSRRA